MIRDDRLPRDAQSILELAARSMFDLFANASEGMMLVDRNARVVWINDQYRRFLPALGFQREEDFVGGSRRLASQLEALWCDIVRHEL